MSGTCTPMWALTPAVVLRFWEKVREDSSGCWLWNASKDQAGYGTFRVADGRTVAAHRISIYLDGRTIPAGMHTDHLCRNPACVNPTHLEVVTRGENVRRGYAAGSRHRTHCKQGHEFTPDNTYVNQEKNGNWRRQCRTCILNRSAARYEQQKKHRDDSV